MVKKTQSEKTHPSESKGFDTAPPGLLTPEQVAMQMGLSLETLAQWRSQKRGPMFVKIARNCVRYRQSDLDGWVSERIVRTDQDRPEGR